MKIKNIVQALLLSFSISSTCFAEASMVVLSFDDNTPYKSWQTAEVMEELMLSDIMNFPEFDLMERSTVKEAVIAEQSLMVQVEIILLILMILMPSMMVLQGKPVCKE